MPDRATQEAQSFRELLHEVRSSPAYWKHFAILQFTTAMSHLMRQAPLTTGRKLADLLGVTPSCVSKALSGAENLTVETMAKMASALDAAVHIHVAKKGVVVHWYEDMQADQASLSIRFTECRQTSSATLVSSTSFAVEDTPQPRDGVSLKLAGPIVLSTSRMPQPFSEVMLG